MDWKFVPRNEGKLREIITRLNIERSSIEIIREISQIIFFVILSK
jgi:hypothetical protein